ncbi:MAG: winged helix-turn-helix domain-containing protein, partial [Candidatus Heimdallarchaeaceae archaeon]
MEKILKAIKEKPKISAKELEAVVGLTRRGIEWNLDKLKKENKIK